MAAAIFRSQTMTASFVALSTTSEVGNYTLFLEGDAGGDVVLLGDDGITSVSFGVGKNFRLVGVDLSTIQAKYGGAALNEKITIAGNTR